MFKFVFWGIVMVGISTPLFAQEKNTQKSIKVGIENINTDQFPQITIQFQAFHSTGIPIWELEKQHIRLLENGKEVKINGLHAQFDKQPIQLGLVIDHSKSMEEDTNQLYDKEGNPLFSVDENNNMIVSETYVTPLEYAKKAIKNFTSSFNLSKDYIAITGFASKVDVNLEPTQNLASIFNTIDNLEPQGKTALYDGIINGIEQLNHSSGPKCLVVLTDGHDNKSRFKMDDVINLALSKEVTIYIVGLGNVAVTELEQLAKETRGAFYHTHSPTRLDEIYGEISQKMKQGYMLTYTSPNNNQRKSTRDIQLWVTLNNEEASAQSIAQLNPNQKNNQHHKRNPITPIVYQSNVSQSLLNIVPEKPNTPIPIGQIVKLMLASFLGIGVLMLKHKLMAKKS